MTWLLFILLGVIAGIVSGMIGLGGGVIIVPALVLLFGFSQKLAQGTTLALLVPPIGLAGAWIYYKQGFVNIHAAIFIILGFTAGSLIGARYITHISNETVTRVFAVFLLLLAIKLLFFGARK